MLLDAMERDLSERDLDVLQARHPKAWARVSEELLSALERNRTDGAHQFVALVKADAAQWRRRLARSSKNPRVWDSAFPHLLRERLALLALQRTAGALATKQTHGTARLGLWSGAIIQRLLFSKGLERKPASLRAFRFWWPLVFDRRLLMPLVEPKGIYCFYSRELVSELAQLIAGRACLEVAAGDGTLSRFLREAGTEVRATDDGSWSHAITLPDDVERLDARAALSREKPRVVLSSWAPSQNSFEKTIFETPSVELYVAIGSRHARATNDRVAWERQQTFSWECDRRLSGMLLPPENDGAVYVFRRK